MKFILGFILGTLLICSLSYAYRVGKPVPINEINPSTLVELNQILEEFWYILNGRYVPETTSSIPTVAAEEGSVKIYSSGGVYRIYIYLNNSWRSWTSD